MSLNSLVLCSDEKIIRVLRRVLGDLEIGMETCSDADSAVRKLTRRRFEAVIVDCLDEGVASQVLSSVRSAPCNKRAIAVAMIDGQKAVRSAFTLGAHFVLYKPISFERARGSFRAARALMKCERRRNARITVEIPVTLQGATGRQQIVTSDIGEGGMAIYLPHRTHRSGLVRMKFTLPGTEYTIESAAEVAWKNAGSHTGIRFVDLEPQHRVQLRAWLARHSSEILENDPPVPCKLSDASPGGCYLEMNAPFPVRTRVVLVMQTAEARIPVDAVVLVMHPEIGMGVAFSQSTEEQRGQVKEFTQVLKKTNGSAPEFMVEPEGMDEPAAASTQRIASGEPVDPLVALFQRSGEFTYETFQEELRSQRTPGGDKTQAAVSS